MTLLDDIKKAIRTDIALYAKLQEALIREQHTVGNSGPGGEMEDRRDAIERSIEKTNARIAGLFREYHRREQWMTAREREQVERLSEELKAAIEETMHTVEITMDTIRDARKHIVSRIRELDSNKSAVNAYERLKTGRH